MTDRRAFAGPVGQKEVNSMTWIPLRAVIRVFQAPETRLIAISPRECCHHLADAIFEIRWQARLTEAICGMFSAVAQLARNYPGWELYFTLEPETETILGKTFG